MATIVKHIDSGKRLALIGTGFGAFNISRPDISLGDPSQNENQGELTMVALATPEGRIFWCDSREVVVESIDGESLRTLLGSL